MQMHAELQVLSPLVPIREVLFLRFCKQHAEGLWAVVDVSVDAILRPDGGNHHHHAQNGGGAAGYMGCRLLPTGCIVQDMNNGYSKVRYHGCAPPSSDSSCHKSARRCGMCRLQCASYARI
jgi:homeobox-leucine zipper protein